MWDIVPCTSHIFYHLLIATAPSGSIIIIPIVQMRKLRIIYQRWHSSYWHYFTLPQQYHRWEMQFKIIQDDNERIPGKSDNIILGHLFSWFQKWINKHQYPLVKIIFLLLKKKNVTYICEGKAYFGKKYYQIQKEMLQHLLKM